jgi:PAS domain S-box-containing protein
MNERILVVDDEPDIIQLCTRLLKSYGYEILSVDSGQKAIDYLEKQGFELVLADIRMPDVDGLDVLRVAKELDPDIAVVMITGYGTMENAIEALRAGAQGFVLKPFTSEELLNAVKEVLSKRQLARENARLRALVPLLEMAQAAVSEADITQPIELAVQITVRETAAEWASLVLPNVQGNVPSITTFTSPHHPTTAAPEEWLQTVAAYVTRTGKPLVSMAAGDLPAELRRENGWAAAFPLLFKGHAIGAFLMGSSSASNLTPDDYEFAIILCSQIAGVISNVELFNRLERTVTELSALKQYNESILRNMGNGLIITDSQGQIISSNDAGEKLLGRRLHKGDSLRPETAPSPLVELATILNKTWETGNAIAHREISFAREDQTVISLKVNTSLLRDEQGQANGVIAVLEDLTELKALEEERRQQDRLAVIGRMAAQVAHEIRNPLVTIGLGIQYLEKSLEPGSPHQQAVQRILHQVERLNNTLNEFLSFSKPPQLHFQPQSLADIIDRATELYSAQMVERHIVLAKEYDPVLPPVLLDAEQMERVVANLVLNAIEAMPCGGQLTIRVRPVTTSSGEMAEMNLADTGVGIAPADIDKVFEPFFSTSPQGAGLGLSIAKRIVEEHKGTISIKSKPGQGTTVTVLLPLR